MREGRSTHAGGQVKQDNCQARRQLTWAAGAERQATGVPCNVVGQVSHLMCVFALYLPLYSRCSVIRFVVYFLCINCQYLLTPTQPLQVGWGEAAKQLLVISIPYQSCPAPSEGAQFEMQLQSGYISFCNTQGYARPHPAKALENSEKQKTCQAIKIATKPKRGKRWGGREKK